MSNATSQLYITNHTVRTKCKSCSGQGFHTSTKTIRAPSRPLADSDRELLNCQSDNSVGNAKASKTQCNTIVLQFDKVESGRVMINQIHFVDIQGECMETCPCQHEARYIFKINNHGKDEFVHYDVALDGEDVKKLFTILPANKTHSWVLPHMSSNFPIHQCDVTDDFTTADATGSDEYE